MFESNKRQKTKAIIENAMVQLLKQESFDHITTVQLAQAAGISRSSFYTHYKDKYDMIERYQQGLFHQLEYIFSHHQENIKTAIIEVFKFLQLEPLLAALLTENGTKEIQNFLRHKLQVMLAEDLQDRFSSRIYSQFEKEYSTVYLTNAFFGVCQIWIARGKKESPEQIADFLLKMI
ncbi:TetR/AcrR family transcriptional regulator [Streptococcus panodentis]|uniref:TetR family transcriptional regulator n=1 Tax=Streptococcus panodentis TaxID=1581472 RepID=A0ABS5AVG6_9STRE|nr:MULTISPECIES: TetR-like C-terminal domain-containing protein [Streptococcus]KXT84967.1 Transcriptional regulator, TetR family [Streptococcus sp. DD11]MBP2620276.1 TetR family transcriptional regulator [Streptococcus panodentis]